VGGVVVALDLLHRDGPSHARPLVELARVGPQVGVVDQSPTVAAEVQVVDLVEARERREQPPVGLGHALADQVAALAEQPVEPVEAVEQLAERALVGVLAAGEAGAVDAVVDGVVDARVDRVYLRAQRRRIQAELGAVAEAAERVGAGHHADDVGGLVVDDPPAVCVPQHWDGDPPPEAGVARAVGLTHERPAVERVGVLAPGTVVEALARERPAALVAERREV